ncbi:MAG TPA: sucrase ferredoxin [Pseudonocardiaceae bacterium]
MLHRPAVPATSCSALSRRLAEPLPGTAPTATAWICLEQPGPWGRDALSQSHLDRAFGRELARRAKAVGIRAVLIRRPGPHADRRVPEPRQVYLAGTRPGAVWLEEALVDDPKVLLELDFVALSTGAAPGFGTPRREPLLLVCTNGRRDRCCALLGRSVACELAAHHPGAVWESAHTGGHRMAPSAVLLPTGYAYGRLDPATAELAFVAAAGARVALPGCRGRSTWSAAGQVAELAVRQHLGEARADALVVDTEERREDDVRVRVRHADGRAWWVEIVAREQQPPRPVSCGKTPSVPIALLPALLVED